MTDTERKEVEELAKLMRVFSGWDWGESDCIRIAEQMIKERYTKRPQNNALVPLDRDKLAKILAQHRGGHSGFPPASWDYDLADVICAKFGKDNSGMVPRKEYLMCSTHQVGIMPNRLCGYCELERLSQQPPKERKVSLEEIKIIKSVLDYYNLTEDGFYTDVISEEIAKRLNATEERKGA